MEMADIKWQRRSQAELRVFGKGIPSQPVMKYVIFNPTTNELFLAKGFADNEPLRFRFDWNWDTVRLVCFNRETRQGVRVPWAGKKQANFVVQD